MAVSLSKILSFIRIKINLKFKIFLLLKYCSNTNMSTEYYEEEGYTDSEFEYEYKFSDDEYINSDDEWTDISDSSCDEWLNKHAYKVFDVGTQTGEDGSYPREKSYRLNYVNPSIKYKNVSTQTDSSPLNESSDESLTSP